MENETTNTGASSVAWAELLRMEAAGHLSPSPLINPVATSLRLLADVLESQANYDATAARFNFSPERIAAERAEFPIRIAERERELQRMRDWEFTRWPLPETQTALQGELQWQ